MYFTPTEDENRGLAAACLAGIATAKNDIGSTEAAKATMLRALDLARQVNSDEYRSRALRAIAAEQARIGEIAAASQTLDEIVVESSRRSAQKEVAEVLARSEYPLEAIRTAETARIERAKLFDELAQIFAERRDLESLKRMLQLCAHETSSAYAFCRLLIELDPEQLKKIQKALLKAE